MVQSTSETSWLNLVAQQSPELTALAIVLVGLALAVALSRLVSFSLARIIRNSEDDNETYLSTLDSSRHKAAQRITFWLIALTALLLAVRVLHIDSLSNWRGAAVEFGSQGLLGVIILVLGVGLATLAKDLLKGVNDSREMLVLADLVRYLILALAVISAFDQVGIDVMLITAVVTAIIGVVAATLGLSFALGSKDYVANLLARGELENLNIGDHISVRDVEGVVTQIRKLNIELATSKGISSVPAAWLVTSGYTKLAEAEDE